MVTTDDIKKMKVAELKEECKKLGLSVDGRKQDLVARLEEAIAAGPATANAAASPAAATAAPSTAAATNGSAPAAAVPKPAAAVPAVKPAGGPIPTTLSDEERKKLRAQKFGTAHMSEADKKKLRAERFGGAPGGTTSAPATAKPAAAATGAAAKAAPAKPSKPLDPSKVPTLEEIERRKARAIKFGTAPPTVEEEEAAKKLARGKKFGTMDEETKRKLRAERFKDAAPNGKPAAIPPPAKKIKPAGVVQ